MKTPKQIGAGDANLEGIKRIMKTPKSKRGKSNLDVTLTGVSDLMMTPEDFYTGQESADKLAYVVELSASPKLPAPGRKSQTPQSGRKSETKVKTPKSASKRAHRRSTPTLKVTSSKKVKSFKSPVDKIVSPPTDFKKVIALRAIHGKSATPKLPSQVKSARRTPKTPKMLWSDVVKKRIDPAAVTGVVQKRSYAKPVVVKLVSRKRTLTPRLQKVRVSCEDC